MQTVNTEWFLSRFDLEYKNKHFAISRQFDFKVPSEQYTHLLSIYNGMKNRCYNKNNPNYKFYGAKGITICNEWLNNENGFRNFYNWSHANGYYWGLSIDRIDNTQGYSPQNCQWMSKSRNSSKVKIDNRINLIDDILSTQQTLSTEYRESLERELAVLKKQRFDCNRNLIDKINAEIAGYETHIKNLQDDIKNFQSKINNETEIIKELKQEILKLTKENEH